MPMIPPVGAGTGAALTVGPGPRCGSWCARRAWWCAAAAAGAGGGSRLSDLGDGQRFRGGGRGGLRREPDDTEGRGHRVVDGGRRDGDGLAGDLRKRLETGAAAAAAAAASSSAGRLKRGARTSRRVHPRRRRRQRPSQRAAPNGRRCRRFRSAGCSRARDGDPGVERATVDLSDAYEVSCRVRVGGLRVSPGALRMGLVFGRGARREKGARHTKGNFTPRTSRDARKGWFPRSCHVW